MYTNGIADFENRFSIVALWCCNAEFFDKIIIYV